MNDEYNLKKFTKVGSKFGNYSISLNGKSFSFGFNSGFYNKENIASYKKVVLFFDEGKKAVGFCFTNNEKAEGAFTVIHSNNKSTGSVTARSFIINNQLENPGYYGQKIPKLVQDDEIGMVYVIQLIDQRDNAV
ncbi:MAG: hypothetical protein PHW53_04090 [Patescibacteria group bacterium]|nr:hypothetical protein [Patescibacteria group bacterium]